MFLTCDASTLLSELGSTEIYPQMLTHSPNGRLLVACGDGEYIIYTALALKNKSFGHALEFAWADDSGGSFVDINHRSSFARAIMCGVHKRGIRRY